MHSTFDVAMSDAEQADPRFAETAQASEGTTNGVEGEDVHVESDTKSETRATERRRARSELSYGQRDPGRIDSSTIETSGRPVGVREQKERQERDAELMRTRREREDERATQVAMNAPEASAEHVQRTANLPAAVPVPAAPADHVEAAPPQLDFSPRTQGAWGTPGWSALSASRPLDFHPAISKLPTPPTALASGGGREGGATHSPAALPMDGQRAPAAADVRLPTLLSTLSASDDESILCIAVEEQHSSEGCPRDQRARDYKGRGAAGDALMHGGRVYGGSQGGSIHVRFVPLVLPNFTKQNLAGKPCYRMLTLLSTGLGPRNPFAVRSPNGA